MKARNQASYFTKLPILLLCQFLLAAVLPWPSAQSLAAEQTLPQRYSLQPENVAVIINDDDAHSVEIGKYYQKAREIPEQNMVHVHIPGSPRRLSAETFGQLKQQIEAQLGPNIQVIVLAWTAPYAVECNSITSALTLGFDPTFARQDNDLANLRKDPRFEALFKGKKKK